MGINGATNQFLDSLTRLINGSGLPPANVRLCLDVARLQVVSLEQQAIVQEQAREAAKAKDKAEGKADE
ncbi:MAG: hypothetical protein LUC30_01355 [Clostridiales bacterium]|nr:hypothetical protein [Clostridiales bacterium]